MTGEGENLSPLMLEEYIDKLLNSALDCGLPEYSFWEMTPGEVIRHIESTNRVKKIDMQEKASRDYILAQLIIKGVGIALGSKETFPTIHETYPGIFDDIQQAQEEQIAQRKDELSALRFKQFAQSYNQKYADKEVPIDE